MIVDDLNDGDLARLAVYGLPTYQRLAKVEIARRLNPGLEQELAASGPERPPARRELAEIPPFPDHNAFPKGRWS